jgi:hypothetical protein
MTTYTPSILAKRQHILQGIGFWRCYKMNKECFKRLVHGLREYATYFAMKKDLLESPVSQQFKNVLLLRE